MILLIEPDYASALIGETSDGKAVYDYDLMVEYLRREYELEEDDAIEFINANTIGALESMGDDRPIIIIRKGVG